MPPIKALILRPIKGYPYSVRTTITRANFRHLSTAFNCKGSDTSSPSKTSVDEETGEPKFRGITRFWNEVEVDGSKDDGYTVNLDGKAIKTPNRKILCTTSKIFAVLVAAEWNSVQRDNPLKSQSLPLTSILNRSIDDLSTAEERRDLITDGLLPYARTDTILFRAEFPQYLVDMETKAWDPILSWAKDRFGLDDLKSTTSLLSSQLSQNDEKILTEHVLKFNALKLAGNVFVFNSTNTFRVRESCYE
jgi:ATP synthase F1 complex assembly factor 2